MTSNSKNAVRMDTFLRVVEPVLYTGRHGNSSSRFDRDVSGRCERPISLELTARDDRNKDRPAAFLDLDVPCRSCEPCRRQRARKWRERAHTELRVARDEGRRTWFVTLTMRPSVHLQMRYQAIRRFNDRGRDPNSQTFEGLPVADARRCVERQSAIEVVKYLKRLRKNSGCLFKYLLVAELHEGPGENAGQVHYHLLITEVIGSLRERLFRALWGAFGFAQAVLVREIETISSYATKVARYISKSPEGRVRASKGYGSVAIFDGSEAWVPRPSESSVGPPLKNQPCVFLDEGD